MRVDKMTMGVSVEGRVPFLDHRFVGLAMSIPSALKTKNGTLKYLLKKAVRGIVPDELITRRKQGFGVPVDELFRGEFQRQAESELRRFCADTDSARSERGRPRHADGRRREALVSAQPRNVVADVHREGRAGAPVAALA